MCGRSVIIANKKHDIADFIIESRYVVNYRSAKVVIAISQKVTYTLSRYVKFHFELPCYILHTTNACREMLLKIVLSSVTVLLNFYSRLQGIYSTLCD